MEGKREGKRRWNQKNQASEEGQLDHRERQRKYRDGNPKDEASQEPADQKVGCVTDIVLKDGSSMAVCPVESGSRLKRSQDRLQQAVDKVICCICGRRGRWIMPFEVKRR